MISPYLSIGILLLLSAGFALAILILASALGPKKYSEVKDEPFECGTIGTGNARGRFGVKFYLVAMLFILFDMEIVFLYPWAVNALELGWTSFIAALGFVFVLLVGLVYVWRQGVLDWQ